METLMAQLVSIRLNLKRQLKDEMVTQQSNSMSMFLLHFDCVILGNCDSSEQATIHRTFHSGYNV